MECEDRTGKGVNAELECESADGRARIDGSFPSKLINAVKWPYSLRTLRTRTLTPHFRAAKSAGREIKIASGRADAMR